MFLAQMHKCQRIFSFPALPSLYDIYATVGTSKLKISSATIGKE